MTDERQIHEATPFDPLAADVMSDPFAAYAHSRDHCPVLKVSGRFERDFYVVSRYDDVKTVMNDHTTWSKREGALLRSTEKDLALSQDPPMFNAFRRIYAAYMGPRGVLRWADAMHAYIAEYLDGIVPLGGGDLHDLFARPLPVKVMATALGLPMDRLDEYRQWTDYFLLSQFNDPDPEAGRLMLERLYGFFDEQFAVRRAALAAAGVDAPSPDLLGSVLSDDLISLLVVSRYRDRPLTEDEMRRTARGFFVGNDTFTSLFLNLLYRLLEDRARWDMVRANPSLIETAIEESLRFDPPAIGMFRLSACPVEMHGVQLPERSRMLFAIPGANRDPAVFDRPDEFRLDRPKAELNRHLSFGYGAHFCPGAAIGRLEAKIALHAVMDRMPDLKLVEQPERIAPFNFWGYRSFQATWSA